MVRNLPADLSAEKCPKAVIDGLARNWMKHLANIKKFYGLPGSGCHQQIPAECRGWLEAVYESCTLQCRYLECRHMGELVVVT